MKRNVMTDHRNRKHKDLREAVRRPHYPEWKRRSLRCMV